MVGVVPDSKVRGPRQSETAAVYLPLSRCDILPGSW